MMRRVGVRTAYTIAVWLVSNSPVVGQSVFLESAGRVTIEAENFHTRLDSSSHGWVVVPGEMAGTPNLFLNYRGIGYVQALPTLGASSPLQAPWIQYRVQISTAGMYRLWVRWTTPDDNSDTFYANISELGDGPGGSIADWYRYVSTADTRNFASSSTWFGSAGFERTDSPFTNGESAAQWNISTPGIYTIRLSMREGGAAIDALTLQLAQLPAPAGVGPPESPQANLSQASEPRNLSAQVSASTVTLQWLPPASGQIHGYRIEAGSATGLSNLAVITTGSATSFVAVSVPNGVYYVRVRAVGPNGVGPPSNETTVAVGSTPCLSTPGSPVGLSFVLDGSLVTLAWMPGGGCAVTTYIVQVGSQSGASNIAIVNNVFGTSLSALAPPGVYFVRVVAQNAIGVSGSSGEIVVTVP